MCFIVVYCCFQLFGFSGRPRFGLCVRTCCDPSVVLVLFGVVCCCFIVARPCGIWCAEAARKTLDTPFFCELCWMLLSNGTTLERFDHRLEGCECHKELWMSKVN